MDAIGSFGKDEVNIGTLGTLRHNARRSSPARSRVRPVNGASGSIPLYYNNTDLQATLSNNTGLELDAKYKWQAWTAYAGYLYIRQQNPSGNYPNDFETIGYYNVPGTIPLFNVPGTFANKNFPTQWAINNAYNIPRVANVFWVGVKYAVNSQLDLIGAFYCLGQNDYNFTVNSKTGVTTAAACTNVTTTGTQPNGTPFSITRLSSGKCAGSTDFLSFLIDYRPVKRVDVYAGVMASNVYGGLMT